METPQGTQPELPPVHEAALIKMQMIAGEYFEYYLIVVSKGTERWRLYKTEDDAFGKASFIVSEIHNKWFRK